MPEYEFERLVRRSEELARQPELIAMTDEFVKARPGTPVTILDNVGHYPMIESPRRFADAVIRYLAE